MGPVTYDPELDVLYVLLSDAEVARTRPLDDLRIVDYDAANVVGVEFVNAMSGVNLTHVPSAVQIERLLDESGLELPRDAPEVTRPARRVPHLRST